jgi:IstB-like ATP binding protein
MCADQNIITDTGESMLTQNTLETLRHLKLHGMAQALDEQRDTPNTHVLSFEERLALLVDRERLSRQNSRYRRLLREAGLKVAQAPADAAAFAPC